MGKFVLFLVAFFFLLWLRGCVGLNEYNVEKLDVYYNTGTVVSTGQCNKSECSYTVKTSTGNLVNSTDWQPVSLGQLVYQKCWTERVLGAQCYVNYRSDKK